MDFQVGTAASQLKASCRVVASTMLSKFRRSFVLNVAEADVWALKSILYCETSDT